MACSDRSHPACSYCWDGAHFNHLPDDAIHMCGFGGEGGDVAGCSAPSWYCVQ
jgi:hypothetical protein